VAVQLIGIGVTLPSVGQSLTPTTAQLAWLGQSLLDVGVSIEYELIALSNNSVNWLSSVGTVVGDFSVTGSSLIAYTYTLTAGTSLFSVSGSTLSLNGSANLGALASITVQASDAGTTVLYADFDITIISTYAPTYPFVGF
jgi:hypothetical protein